jgi:hypothetical protein
MSSMICCVALLASLPSRGIRGQRLKEEQFCPYARLKHLLITSLRIGHSSHFAFESQRYT